MPSSGLYASPEEFHKESFMGLSDLSLFKGTTLLSAASLYVITTYAVAVSPSLPARPDS